MKSQKEQLLENGMNDCIEKPIRLDYLQATLASIASGTFQPKTQDATKSKAKELEKTGDVMINFDQAEMFLRNKEGVKLYHKFVSQVSNELEDLQTKADHLSSHDLGALIHDLTGSAALFGFNSLKHKFAEIEQFYNERDMPKMRPSIHEAIELLEQSCEQIQKKYNVANSA